MNSVLRALIQAMPQAGHHETVWRRLNLAPPIPTLLSLDTDDRMSPTYTIDTMAAGDWPQVRSIYLQGVVTGHATFEQEAPSWEQWDEGHLDEGRLVARAGASVIGWAALSRVSGRCVYSGVAEVSIYVGQTARGQGIGSALLGRLVLESERLGLWTLQAGVFPENTASLGLHRRHGFREVGRRERIGQRNGVWRDVVLLERRSSVVGL